MSTFRRMTWFALSLAVAGCGETARLPFSAGVGPDPTLPAPNRTLIPTVDIAPAKGWPRNGKPSAAQGLEVARFADGLDHPRWLHVLPNGDVLVAESNAPPKPADERSIKGWIQKQVMKRAGAGVPSANRITLLRDADGDGVAEAREPFLEGLNSPFGMALVGGELYVANTDALVRYPYAVGQTRISAPATTVIGLPGGPINHHWTKNVVASADGSRLYVTTGSNSNVAERGIEAEGCGAAAGLGVAAGGPSPGKQPLGGSSETCRAAIWEVDPRAGTWRVFASGLRNPNGMAWEPRTGALWTVVNERDEIGSDLVPDYLTAVRDGGFYGWPYSYFGRHVDARAQPPRPDLVARAIKPDFALGTHVAPLGLAWSGGAALPARFGQGMFVGQHGSWNRRPMSGYDVVFVPFRDGRPTGEPPLPVLAGFVDADGHALGRPVGVAIDRRGALLVADDVGNAIWRVTAAGGAQGAGR